MSKRMALLVVFVIALAVGLVLYQRHRTYTHYNSGEVTAAAAFDRPLNSPAGTPGESSEPRSSAKPSAGQPLSEPSTASEPGSLPADESENSGDSVPANPPENAIFSGKGRYQVYRQGNLTWRLDTESGTTCVLFATDEEWRKPRVYNQACANN